MNRRPLPFLPLLLLAPSLLLARPLNSADFHKMRSVGSVALSPDGTRVAYSVAMACRMFSFAARFAGRRAA